MNRCLTLVMLVLGAAALAGCADSLAGVSRVHVMYQYALGCSDPECTRWITDCEARVTMRTSTGEVEKYDALFEAGSGSETVTEAVTLQPGEQASITVRDIRCRQWTVVEINGETMLTDDPTSDNGRCAILADGVTVSSN